MTINSLILGLLAHPRVVKRAQEELDRVIGTSRLPTFGDEENLPYIRAIVKEVDSPSFFSDTRFSDGGPRYHD
jgi:cytochrome P450